jgi:uncharacterized membrane protein YdjX (TVP38/TMEM64 family)
MESSPKSDLIDAPSVPKGSSRGGTARLVVGVLVLVVLIFIARRFGAGAALKDILDWISSLGALAPVVFIAIYIVACVMFVPGSILTIGAGVLFGLVWGSIYVSIASTTGAAAAFLVGRYLARDWVARKVEDNSKFKAIDDAVGREGWKIVVLTRLSPIFPFNLLNYAFGLTKVGLRDYVVASWAGMIPGTLMFVYIGSLSGDLARAASGAPVQTPLRWALDAIGLAATIAVAVYATRIATQALRERT